MDALRPHVPRLWQRLPVADRRAFLRHVARYWEVHRHRMPPDTARRVSALLGTGRLSVHAGQVRAVTTAPGACGCASSTAGASTEHEAAWLVNATGPDGDITRTGDPLLRGLLRRGLARPDPLRLGLDATPGGAVLDAAGRPSGTLFTLGPPLRRAVVRDHGHPGDQDPGRRPGPAPHRSRPGARPPGHRRVTSGCGPGVCPPTAAGPWPARPAGPPYYEWVTFCPVRCGAPGRAAGLPPGCRAPADSSGRAEDKGWRGRPRPPRGQARVAARLATRMPAA